MLSQSHTSKALITILSLCILTFKSVLPAATQPIFSIRQPLTEIIQKSIFNSHKKVVSWEINDITWTQNGKYLAATVVDFNFRKEIVSASVLIWPQDSIIKLIQTPKQIVRPLQPLYLVNSDIINVLAWRDNWRNKWDTSYILATGSNSGNVNLFKIQDENTVKNLGELHVDGTINSMVWNNVGEYLIIGADSNDVGSRIFGLIFILKLNEESEHPLELVACYKFDNGGITINGISCCPFDNTIAFSGEDLSVYRLVNWIDQSPNKASYLSIYQPNQTVSQPNFVPRSALFSIIKWNPPSLILTPVIVIAQVAKQDPCTIELNVLNLVHEIEASQIIHSPTPIKNLSVEWLNPETVLIVHDNYEISGKSVPPKYRHKASGSNVYTFNIVNKALTRLDNLPDIYISCAAIQQMIAFGTANGLVFVKNI
ncbi:MAG: hypothetical protein US49_C0006G0196 [candidate division TM6 bacterium GW2011_GWF2_37_49]|nr:MAG: hypothetical protein US49_C0006G0196 [candidate division TM6 bacterium GW2011_GWF2_37_49]